MSMNLELVQSNVYKSNVANKNVEKEKVEKDDKVKGKNGEGKKADTKDAVVYEKSEKDAKKNTNATYSDPTKRAELVKSLKAVEEANRQNLVNMLKDLLKKQGVTFEQAMGGKIVKIDIETREKAKEAISENGELGVEAVSSRLVDFAKALTAGDPKKAEEMRAAIKKGFEEAKEVFGGNLPEICSKTYERTMEKLDEWAKSGQEEK